jgi:hypothetical protein
MDRGKNPRAETTLDYKLLTALHDGTVRPLLVHTAYNNMGITV